MQNANARLLVAIMIAPEVLVASCLSESRILERPEVYPARWQIESQMQLAKTPPSNTPMR